MECGVRILREQGEWKLAMNMATLVFFFFFTSFLNYKTNKFGYSSYVTHDRNQVTAFFPIVTTASLSLWAMMVCCRLQLPFARQWNQTHWIVNHRPEK